MNWNNLSIRDKAQIIKLGVSSGIHDLDTIRDTYNNVYAEGGEKPIYTLSEEDIERGRRIRKEVERQQRESEKGIAFVERLQQNNTPLLLIYTKATTSQ